MPQSDSVFSSGVLGGADDRGGHGGDPLRLHALPTYEGHRRATGHPEGQSSPGEWGPAGPPPGAHRAEDPSLINLLWEAQREKKEKSWAPSTLLHSTSGWTSATRSTSQVSPVSPELFKKKTTTTNSFHVTSFNRKTSWCERDLLGWADDVIKKLRVFRVGPSIILVLVFFLLFFFLSATFIFWTSEPTCGWRLILSGLLNHRVLSVCFCVCVYRMYLLERMRVRACVCASEDVFLSPADFLFLICFIFCLPFLRHQLSFLSEIFFFFLQFNFSHKPSAVFGLNRTFLISYIWHQFCSFQINSSFTTVKISVLINLKTLYQLSLSFLFPQLCEYFQPAGGDKAAWILFILSWNKSFCIFLKQDFSSVMLQQNDNTV